MEINSIELPKFSEKNSNVIVESTSTFFIDSSEEQIKNFTQYNLLTERTNSP